MAEKDLIEAIGRKYGRMSPGRRAQVIRQLRGDGRKFMRRFFPKFYAEAFRGVDTNAKRSGH